jgi:hypothetical protein
MNISNFRLSLWLTVDINIVIVPLRLHRSDADNIAEKSEIHITSIFSVKICGANQFLRV